jgi:hypothetical protein
MHTHSKSHLADIMNEKATLKIKKNKILSNLQSIHEKKRKFEQMAKHVTFMIQHYTNVNSHPN